MDNLSMLVKKMVFCAFIAFTFATNCVGQEEGKVFGSQHQDVTIPVELPKDSAVLSEFDSKNKKEILRTAPVYIGTVYEGGAASFVAKNGQIRFILSSAQLPCIRQGQAIHITTASDTFICGNRLPDNCDMNFAINLQEQNMSVSSFEENLALFQRGGITSIKIDDSEHFSSYKVSPKQSALLNKYLHYLLEQLAENTQSSK